MMKPEGISYDVQLDKRDLNNVPNYTSGYRTYEPRDTVTIELLTKGQCIYQSWIQPTYNNMYTKEIFTLADYLLTDVYDIIQN